jgi:hypothetical protein
LLAASSAVLHGISLGHAANAMAMLLMVTMIAGCLYCARDLWRHGTQRGWVLVALMNFAMIAVHLPMPAEHHHTTGLVAALPAHDSTVMTVATALAAVEVTAAAVVLYYRTRALRTPTLTGCPGRTNPIGCPQTMRGSSASNLRRSPGTP